MTPAYAITRVVHAVAAIPAPYGGIGNVGPKQPTFAGKFTDLVSYGLWACTMLCVLGIAIIGTQMALAIRRGETGEHATRLGAAAAGVVIVGMASTIVNALL